MPDVVRNDRSIRVVFGWFRKSYVCCAPVCDAAQSFLECASMKTHYKLATAFASCMCNDSMVAMGFVR